MRLKVLAGSLLVGVTLIAAYFFMEGPESHFSGNAAEAFTPCLPSVLPDLSLSEEAKKGRAFLLCEQAERAAGDSSRDPGALWKGLENAQEASALLALVSSPAGTLSLKVTDVKGRLLTLQREEADRLLLEARTRRRRGDSAGSETCLRRLLRLIPDSSHPLHQRVRRELGDW